jgi:hypothetical protein
VLDCFVQTGAELQRTQVAPEGDAYTFSQIASTEGVTTGSRYPFITPTLNGVIQDFSYANPNRSNRVLERFARVVEVPQVRFHSAIDLLSGDDDQFGHQKAAGTYVATTDTEVDSSKTYYTKSGDEYTAVASPTKSGLANYYELQGAGKDLNFMVVDGRGVQARDQRAGRHPARGLRGAVLHGWRDAAAARRAGARVPRRRVHRCGLVVVAPRGRQGRGFVHAARPLGLREGADRGRNGLRDRRVVAHVADVRADGSSGLGSAGEQRRCLCAR